MWLKPRIEALESKRLLTTDMTATYDAVANKLTVVGTSTANSLVVRADSAGDIELHALSGSGIAGDTSAPRGADLDIRLHKGDDYLLIDDMGVDDCAGCESELVGTFIFRGGDGEDTVDVISVTAETLDIATHVGADEVTFGVSAELEGSDAAIVAGEIIVATGSEDDTVSVYSLEVSKMKIRTHEGDDIVLVDVEPLAGGVRNASNLFDVETSSGHDDIYIHALTTGLLDINSGEDLDEISLGDPEDGAPSDVTAAKMLVQSGEGGDFIFVANITSNDVPEIRTASGDDRVWVGAGVSEVQISTAVGEDMVIVTPAASSSLELMVFLGGNYDEIQLLTTPSVDSFFQGGAGLDTICGESEEAIETLDYAGFEQICFPD